MIWSKVKRLLGSAAARTVDTLHEAFGDAMAAVTTGDIAGCFRHYGDRLAGAVRDLRAELGTPEFPFVAGQLGEFL